MAKKQGSEPPTRPSLLIPRSEAAEKIRVQIEKGRQLGKLDVNSYESLERVRADKTKWVSYTSELLKRIFDHESLAAEFEYAHGPMFMRPSSQQVIQSLKEGIAKKVTSLEAILDRLELIPEANTSLSSSAESSTEPLRSTDIFVVHGRDDAAKESVSRFIERLGLRVVILHEQANAGRTIIEKFEHHSNVGFAVVLLTPDDIGAPKDRPEEGRPRARQNVIFELGYFVGKVTRGRVCALYKEGVELPSDFQGILYVPMDSSGGWKLSLAKEIKQAGIEVDLNKVV